MSDNGNTTRLVDFTFTDSGKSVKVRKISPMLATDVAAAIPEPEPPAQEVDYGGSRGTVMEKNYSDPGYLAEKAEWQKKVVMAVQRVMLLKAIVPVEEDWREQVAEYREFIERYTEKPLAETEDIVVYALRILVGSEEDLADLIRVITKRSQPTQEAVQEAKRSFRG